MNDPNEINRQVYMPVTRGSYEEPPMGRFRRTMRWVGGILVLVIVASFILDLFTGIGMFGD